MMASLGSNFLQRARFRYSSLERSIANCGKRLAETLWIPSVSVYRQDNDAVVDDVQLPRWARARVMTLIESVDRTFYSSLLFFTVRSLTTAPSAHRAQRGPPDSVERVLVLGCQLNSSERCAILF